jgi:hypothetical protein
MNEVERKERQHFIDRIFDYYEQLRISPEANEREFLENLSFDELKIHESNLHHMWLWRVYLVNRNRNIR